MRAALNHRAGRLLGEEGYKQQFRQHFEYGCQRLKEIWAESGNDQVKFVTELLKRAGDDLGLATSGTGKAPMSVVSEAIKLKLMADVEEWVLNSPGGNGLLVISGKPGSGKSQLALDLLSQISRQGVRFVFFDLKGELESTPANKQQQGTRDKFLKQTGASYIRLIQQCLPVNPLYRTSKATENTQIAYEIAQLIRYYAPQLGAKQERALCDAYQRLTAPDFTSFAQELEDGGAEGVELSIIKKIRDFRLFSDADRAIDFEKWLSTSLVIDFKELGNDSETKSLAVALILNFLMKRLNTNLSITNNVQPIKMVLFVDEAHLLLPKESKAGLLGSLARQGRSWGFPVWLASQDADSFLTTGDNATNFAELAGCGIHFSPQTLSNAQQKQILGSVLSRELKQGEAAVRLGGKLQTGAARQFWKDGGK